jgi:hypothetical protein
MIACIIYTDPAQDGNVTVENGYPEYPDGGARNPSQVQRGSVGSSIYVHQAIVPRRSHFLGPIPLYLPR